MTNDKIMPIVLAAAVLLGLSWPAAAQQRAQGAAARFDLNVAVLTAALEAELNDLEVVEADADADVEPTEDAAATEPTAAAGEVVLEGPYGPKAITSWGSRSTGDGPGTHLRTVILEMRRPDKD